MVVVVVAAVVAVAVDVGSISPHQLEAHFCSQTNAHDPCSYAATCTVAEVLVLAVVVVGIVDAVDDDEDDAAVGHCSLSNRLATV